MPAMQGLRGEGRGDVTFTESTALAVMRAAAAALRAKGATDTEARDLVEVEVVRCVGARKAARIVAAWRAAAPKDAGGTDADDS